MNRGDQILARLRQLRAEGVLAASAAGGTLREILAPLVAGGVVVNERHGAGRRYRVHDPAAFASFLASRFPDPDHAAEPGNSRATGIARFRDSKSMPADTPEMVVARVWDSTALRQDGREVGAGAATSAHGIFGFVLAEPARWTLHGSCALVENPALFLRFESLQLPVALALYGRGRCSERLLQWFARQEDDAFSVLHLPDYDPVGLDEFMRLHGHLGPRARLHRPDDLGARFARHGNRGLLRGPNTLALLARLRHQPLPAVREVVQWIDRYQAGLEQESLLLP